jgi:hypothetical protein
MRTFGLPTASKSALGEIELDRLLNAVRRAIEANHPPPLLQPPIAANDDGLAWPLIHFPEGGCDAEVAADALTRL